MADLRKEIEKRRTFAIISHPDAGKTTLTEKFLLYGGAINLAGSVKGKATARHAVSDWMEIEKERGISVTSSVLQSAIVHMVDGLLKKLEVLDEDTVGSNWNQDMVIYQTLNEYSAAGLYDRSGLSMNMFLKIREYLVNEEALLV